MSQLIFNAVVDPIHCFLDNRDEGLSINGQNVFCLAFADVLVLLSKARGHSEHDLKLAAQYFASLGMNLSLPKSCAFQYVTGNKTWTIEDPKLTINKQLVKFIGPEDSFCCLGIEFTPWRGGISGKAVCQELLNCFKRVQYLPLKQLQKLDLMFGYRAEKFTRTN